MFTDHDWWPLGPESIWRWHLTSIGNPIVEIRRSYDRLISTMGFPILVRWHLYIESAPWSLFHCYKQVQRQNRNRNQNQKVIYFRSSFKGCSTCSKCMIFSSSRIVSWALSVKLLAGECYITWWWKASIGLGNKSYPEPMLTPTICYFIK